MEWKRWLRRFLVAVSWNYQIRILMWDISVIIHIRNHVWFLVFCLQLLLQSDWFSILLSVITPMWDFRQEKQTCMYFQCHNYFTVFLCKCGKWSSWKMQSLSLFKKSLCYSSSYPTVSSYESKLLYTFEGTDRNNLCLANQDCLCDAFIFSPKICRIQLAFLAWFLACGKRPRPK